jgi:hypothetical protein
MAVVVADRDITLMYMQQILKVQEEMVAAQVEILLNGVEIEAWVLIPHLYHHL